MSERRMGHFAKIEEALYLTGKTHLTVGTAATILITQPSDWKSFLLCMGAAAEHIVQAASSNPWESPPFFYVQTPFESIRHYRQPCSITQVAAIHRISKIQSTNPTQKSD